MKETSTQRPGMGIVASGLYDGRGEILVELDDEGYFFPFIFWVRLPVADVSRLICPFNQHA